MSGACRCFISFIISRFGFSRGRAAAFILAGCLGGAIACGSGGISPAAAIDLSSDPYIKAPPYQPPPLAGISPEPLGGPPPAHSSASHPAYNPPQLMPPQHKKRDFGRQSRHILWCRQNHPSYRQTDNTYRPFDRAGTMPPQGRVPCVSPGD